MILILKPQPIKGIPVSVIERGACYSWSDYHTKSFFRHAGLGQYLQLGGIRGLRIVMRIKS